MTLTFRALRANRMWFKDYITSFLPSINLQFRASDLKAEFCPLANRIWFIFLPFHNFAPKLKTSCPAVTVGRLIYCRLLCEDLLCAGRWVLASLHAEGGFPSKGRRKEQSGQIKKEESAKWKEVWAVRFWLYPMLWRLSQETYQQLQFFCSTEIDKNLSNPEHPIKIQKVFF